MDYQTQEKVHWMLLLYTIGCAGLSLSYGCGWAVVIWVAGLLLVGMVLRAFDGGR